MKSFIRLDFITDLLKKQEKPVDTVITPMQTEPQPRSVDEAVNEAAAKLKEEFPNAAVVVGIHNSTRYWFHVDAGMAALALVARMMFYSQVSCQNASNVEAMQKAVSQP